MCTVFEICFKGAVCWGAEYNRCRANGYTSKLGRWNYLCEEVNRVIYICNVSQVCVHNPVPMDSIYKESVLRPVEGFSERLNSIVIAHETEASLNATIDSTLKYSPTAGKLLILFAVRELSVWSCSSYVLQRRQTPASVSSSASSWFVHSVYFRKVNSVALANFGMTVRNRSSAFATQNLFGTARKRIAVRNRSSMLSLFQLRQFQKFCCSCFGYAASYMVQRLCLFLCLKSGTRPPRMYPELSNSTWISCRDCEQSCRATSFTRLTNVRALSVSSKVRKFLVTSLAHFGTCSFCNAFSMKCTVVLELYLERNGPVV